MAVPWPTTLLRMDAFVTKVAPSLEPPLKVFRTWVPLITTVGLGVVVWWRSRRDQGTMRRRMELTVELPTTYTLLWVLGYLTVTLLVSNFQTLTLLLPLGLIATCNLRPSTPRPMDDEGEPETPQETTGESLRFSTPPSSCRPRKLFHIHSNDQVGTPPTRQTNLNPSLLTPPATIPRRRHISYEPQMPPIIRTERPSFRTRVSSTPSNEIRRTRKGSTNRRYASENCEENLVPRKEVWDTSFELLLYNLSKSRKPSLVQPQPRYDASSSISSLAPSPLINSS